MSAYPNLPAQESQSMLPAIKENHCKFREAKCYRLGQLRNVKDLSKLLGQHYWIYRFMNPRTYFEQDLDTTIEDRHAIRRDLGMPTKASNSSTYISHVNRLTRSAEEKNTYQQTCRFQWRWWTSVEGIVRKSTDLANKNTVKFLPTQSRPDSRPMMDEPS